MTNSSLFGELVIFLSLLSDVVAPSVNSREQRKWMCFISEGEEILYIHMISEGATVKVLEIPLF